MVITDELALQQEIERVGRWLDTLPNGESQKVITDRLLELAALLYHAPASFQPAYLYWIAKTVIGMPMVVLATATADESGNPNEAKLLIEMVACCKGMVAPGLAPIVEKLRKTADSFEKMHKETTFKGECTTLFDSDRPAAGQA